VRIAGLRAEICAWELPTTKQEYQLLDSNVRLYCVAKYEGKNLLQFSTVIVVKMSILHMNFQKFNADTVEFWTFYVLQNWIHIPIHFGFQTVKLAFNKK
jgi:hypothetical protein